MEELDRIIAALRIARDVHTGQTDRAGKPYGFHIIAVAAGVAEQGLSEHVMCAAILHDSIEDSSDPDAIAERIARDVGEDVLDIVLTLTHEEGESYDAYIARIAKHPDAVAVKLADLRHNMRRDRLPEVTARDERRLAKYQRAYDLLK
jgi:(p)ppGpp synthase/HD superfamily hydrolase